MRHNEHCRENEEAQLKQIADEADWSRNGIYPEMAISLGRLYLKMGPIKPKIMTIGNFEDGGFPIAMATCGSHFWTQNSIIVACQPLKR